MRIITQSKLAVLVLALTGGCSFNFKPVSIQPAALTGGQVLPHRVALVLTPEFTDYKHTFHLMGETDVYPVGDALRDYASNVAGKSFRQVDVVPSELQAAALTSDDLILIPKVVKSDSSFGKRKFNLTLVVEWTARKPHQSEHRLAQNHYRRRLGYIGVSVRRVQTRTDAVSGGIRRFKPKNISGFSGSA